MLLAMVEDVRAVVIKMAERICALQQVKKADEETRVMVARECASIYAPLANRLGIGQLKWELEDLAFRYLHPITYIDNVTAICFTKAQLNLIGVAAIYSQPCFSAILRARPC